MKNDSINPILQMKGISKHYGGVKALSNVDLDLHRGSIHGIVGENGAGKSTLVKIISGALIDYEGGVFLNAERVRFSSPRDAQKKGVGIVYQELSVINCLTVAENIFMSAINKSKSFIVNYKKFNSQAVKILKPLANDIRPDKPVSTLSVSHQQVVEIAKALSLNCEVLILDEPTSTLSESETKALFKILHELKNKGIGIIYISHRMGEVFSECDRVTVLRDGEYLGTYNIKDVDRKEIVNNSI